jgi:hypothetical protein
MTKNGTASSTRKPARGFGISCILPAGAFAAQPASAADDASALR